MTRVADEPCILLHSRAYRESSLILSALTLNHGRVSLISRGARAGKRGRILQTLNCLRVNWSGRSSLLTLGHYELEMQPMLAGDALASGFYLAELTTRLLSERESHPRLFAGLYWALQHLNEDLEPVLRSFEKLLLDDLGYGFDFTCDARTREPVIADARYLFDPALGFVLSESGRGFAGSSILAIAAGDYRASRERRLAKRIFRQALAQHLGPRPLLSRKLLYSRKAS
jgi:DNA repair protein RecO (recombination protein O)